MSSSVLNATNSTFELLGLVARHIHGDWRCIDPENTEMNLRAVDAGDRILLAYAIYPEKSFAGFGDSGMATCQSRACACLRTVSGKHGQAATRSSPMTPITHAM